MVKWFNNVSSWVKTEILTETDVKRRAKTVEKFIDVAWQLIKLGNYNGTLEIVSALESSDIYRLKNTWAFINESKLSFYHSRIQILANISKLRDSLLVCTPPVIPYIGMYLTEMIQIDEGNFTKTDDGLLNIGKFQLLSRTVGRLHDWQRKTFHLQTVPIIQEFMSNLIFVDDEEISLFSLYIEPKVGTEKPEMPRKLKEIHKKKNFHNRSKSQTAKKKRIKNVIQTSEESVLMVMQEHREQCEMECESFRKGLYDMLMGIRFEEKNNPEIVAILDKIQTATMNQLASHKQKISTECHQTNQKLQKIKFNIGPVLEDPLAVPTGSNIPTLVQWLWNDDKGKFVPYDTQTTVILEAQYQKTPNGSVKLTHGFFGKNLSGYIVDFKQMKQIQCETNYSRPVQRRLNWITYSEHKQKVYELQQKFQKQDKEHEIKS
eukprot:TRINITY_DN15562_c0_g1_i1.p1 TRINITY_DN15562_c0_g1~~TRINITY_DN15562_c0_g1_i1.p1  ORF type:complete len:505 (+),score=77.96 TRINITY_DN15562_c0_g1_i1:219-1517(+)